MAEQQTLQIAYDMTSHHALGGGSYVFKSNYSGYLRSLLPHPEARTEINIIIQPNSSPHIGTLCSLGLAFVLARRMKDIGTDVTVVCDLWDRVKGEQIVINNITYQQSLQDTGKFQKFLSDYTELLAILSNRYRITHRIRLEEEFLKSDGVGGIIREIIKDRDGLIRYLAPATGRLAIRAACPECGLVDKYGVNNIYSQGGSSVSFECPHHGRFEYNVDSDSHRFQFNCQLFNLVIGRYYERASYNYIEVCGSDYAGFWQRAVVMALSGQAHLDYWSGSKVSKSLYLQPTAYGYLKRAGQEYLLSYRIFKQEKKDFTVLLREIERWVNEPYRLFRGYSLHYLHLLFEKMELSLGIIHKPTSEPETE
ncbi:hypothetical protein AJ79_04623 [Helicocarpus griseus UAMH5409]|uniref:Uncharacterized protein n=1 Tax=Helicocarpus griseus UAMH5409 TaxID=1447875 RepID=A0A2B7XRH0_9EURO|nr:hypothetical protein AJ79_04623 [Helicocarpus griseus UAMH5409]